MLVFRPVQKLGGGHAGLNKAFHKGAEAVRLLHTFTERYTRQHTRHTRCRNRSRPEGKPTREEKRPDCQRRNRELSCAGSRTPTPDLSPPARSPFAGCRAWFVAGCAIAYRSCCSDDDEAASVFIDCRLCLVVGVELVPCEFMGSFLDWSAGCTCKDCRVRRPM